MAKVNDYHQQISMQRTQRIRDICRELPDACRDYFFAISQTTSALTRLAYAYDLRVFFQYLTLEQASFAGVDPRLITIDQIAGITARQLRDYQDYLTMYIKQNEETNSEVVVNNHELGIMRKMCAVRSFFEYLFTNEKIPANITTLVPLPKLHEKPILYLEKEEVEKLLEVAENGEEIGRAHV